MTESKPIAADCLQRFIFINGQARGAVVHLASSFHTLMEQHNYPAPIRQLLGETLLSAILLTSPLKFQGQITLQMQTDGPIKLLVAKCNDQLHVRGLAQWELSSFPSSLDHLLGSGELMVTVEPEEKISPYQSIIPLIGGSIVESLTQYFSISEQLPTFIKLGVHEKTAVGLFLQTLPQANTEEDALFWQHITTLAQTLTNEELLFLETETILHRLFHQEDIQLFTKEPVSFNCNCTIAKMENVIRAFGQEEANAILAEQHCIAVTCEYCNYEYSFTRNEVENLFQQ